MLSRWSAAALLFVFAATSASAASNSRSRAAAAAAPCSGSSIHPGDPLPTDPAEPLQTVDDIYSIWGGPDGTAEIGWFYFASDRKTIFLQYNYASIARFGTRALGIHLDSVTAPGGFGAPVKWNHQRVAQRYHVIKCAIQNTSVG